MFGDWPHEPLDTWAPESVDVAYRRQAVATIARFFVGAGMGLGMKVDGDGRYSARGIPRTAEQVSLFRRMTEGRSAENPKMYTCGELVACVYSLAGCRDEQIVNRDDDDLDGVPDAKQPSSPDRGSKPWKVGWNLTLLKAGSERAGCWMPANAGYIPAQGDAFMLGENNDGHVGLWEEDPQPTDNPDEWAGLTIEAGQVDAGGQCCCRYMTFMRREGNKVFVSRTPGKGGRVLLGHVNLALLPLSAPARLPPSP